MFLSPGILGAIWGHLCLSHWGCSWHRVGGGHERCSAPHGAHDGPTEQPAQCPQCEGSWSVPTHPGPQACELSRVLDGSAHVARSPGGGCAARGKLQPRRHPEERHTLRKGRARSHVPGPPPGQPRICTGTAWPAAHAATAPQGARLGADSAGGSAGERGVCAPLRQRAEQPSLAEGAEGQPNERALPAGPQWPCCH